MKIYGIIFDDTRQARVYSMMKHQPRITSRIVSRLIAADFADQEKDLSQYRKIIYRGPISWRLIYMRMADRFMQKLRTNGMAEWSNEKKEWLI
jgi:hypothetical protein